MLVNEPWCLKPWEVAKLNPYQVNRLYFVRRDDRGQIMLAGETPVSAFDIFRQQWERLGAPEWRIKRMWRKIKAGWDNEAK